MDEARTILRRIWPAEVLFAAVALFFASGLPVPPTEAREWYLTLHWYGIAGAAALLAWKARRPSAVVWFGAAALSGYVLVNALLGWRPVVDAIRGGRDPAASISAALFVIPVLAQSAVAVSCWRSRRLARWGRSGAHVA